jgi:hypothetical protein
MVECYGLTQAPQQTTYKLSYYVLKVNPYALLLCDSNRYLVRWLASLTGCPGNSTMILEESGSQWIKTHV